MIYNQQALPFVLEAIGKSVDSKGFLVDQETGEFFLTAEREKANVEDLVGFENKLPVIRQVNPFLEKMTILKELEEEARVMEKKYREDKEKIDNRITELWNLCTHKNADRTSAWEYAGQDPGSGKTEHSCSICGITD